LQRISIDKLSGNIRKTRVDTALFHESIKHYDSGRSSDLLHP